MWLKNLKLMFVGEKIDPGPEITTGYIQDKVLWECRNCEGRMKTAYLLGENHSKCPLCQSHDLMVIARTPNEVVWALGIKQGDPHEMEEEAQGVGAIEEKAWQRQKPSPHLPRLKRRTKNRAHK